MSINRILTSGVRKRGQQFILQEAHFSHLRESLLPGSSPDKTIWHTAEEDQLSSPSPLGQAEAALASRRYDDALKLFQDALEQATTSQDQPLARVQAHQGMAEAYAHRGHFAQARASYEAALAALDSTGRKDSLTQAFLLNNLALILRRTECYFESESCYVQAINSLPENGAPETRSAKALMHNNLGLLYHATGHLEEAVTMHQKALELISDGPARSTTLRAEALANRGLAAMALGRYDLAAEDLRRSVRFLAAVHCGPKRQQLHLAISSALAFLRCGRHDAAWEQAQLALEIHDLMEEEPGNDLAAIHSILGFLHVVQGKIEDAIRHYEASLSALSFVLVPDAIEMADAHFNLALIHASTESSEQSQYHLCQAAVLIDSLSGGAKERDEHFRQVFAQWFDQTRTIPLSNLPDILLLKQPNVR